MAQEPLHAEGLASLVERAVSLADLEPTLDHDDYWECVKALSRRAGRDTFEAAASLCASADALKRVVGADILANLGRDYETYECPFADESEPVLVPLLGDECLMVVGAAVHSLGQLRRGSVADLMRVKGHSVNVRRGIAYALGLRDDAIPALIELSSDEDADTRDWATFGIAQQYDEDTPEIREALAARLADENADVRGEAVMGLARRRDSRAIDAISRELHSGNDLAISAAEEMPRRQFISELERLASEQPNDQAIADALAACRNATE